MNIYLTLVILAALTGLACYIIARKKGRDAYMWFLGGVIFNIFTLVVLLGIRSLRNPKKSEGRLKR